MKNVDGQGNKSDKPTFNRTFKIDTHLNFGLYSYSNVVQASFFDIYEDVILFCVELKKKEKKKYNKYKCLLFQGYLDILLVVKEADDSYKVVAYKNEYDDDVYFLKVMVIPGTCQTDSCPEKTLVNKLFILLFLQFN